jgi:hypothetical protein
MQFQTGWDGPGYLVWHHRMCTSADNTGAGPYFVDCSLVLPASLYKRMSWMEETGEQSLVHAISATVRTQTSTYLRRQAAQEYYCEGSSQRRAIHQIVHGQNKGVIEGNGQWPLLLALLCFLPLSYALVPAAAVG